MRLNQLTFIAWTTFIIILWCLCDLFWRLKASVCIHWNCMEKSDKRSLLNFSFYVSRSR